MSILAEPRRRQRISIDPQNLEWKNNDQTVSKKLMKKMGWSDGDGLGKNRQGSSDHIKLKANHSGKGLGADKLASYDSTWIGHHDDFADLLSALNKNKEVLNNNDKEEDKDAIEKMSMELKSKSVRRRIHYQKFTRAKDTSNYTENDRSSILGIGVKRVKDEEDSDEAKEEEKKESDIGSDTKHTVSTLSVSDYFAAKMAALKAKQAVKSEEPELEVKVETEDVDVKQEVEDPEEEERLRKERKLAKKMAKLARKQQEEQELLNYDENKVKEEPNDDAEVQVEKPKKKRKYEDISEQNLGNDSDEASEVQSSEKKKKKKKDKENEAEEADIDEAPAKKSKKEKKSRKNDDQ